MTIQNGTVYENNYARAAASFLGTCAPEPADGARRSAHALITGLYKAIAADAAGIGFKPVPDVSFAPWEQQKGREADVKAIRSALDKLEALVSEFFLLVEAAEAADACTARLPEGAKPGRTLQNALRACGVPLERTDGRAVLRMQADCLEALKELAAISRSHTVPVTDGPNRDKPYLLFSRGVFEPGTDWIAAAFDRLLGADGALLSLCAALEARGYRRVDCFDGKKVGLDYVKLYGKKEEPLKCPWAERTHAGISLSYEELRLAPAFLWLRMPVFKTVLARADELPADARAFLARCTKRCDGCRYCVQTDKTGARPLACLPVDGVKLCPLFPGFSMNWRALTPALAGDLLSLLDALEALPGLSA